MVNTVLKEKQGSQPVKTEEIRPKIMTKPLPQILDELEDYIGRVEEAVRQARAAAGESREAAAQAKLAGEKAAEAARKAAEAAVAKVKEEITKTINALAARVSSLETEVSTLKEQAILEALSLDKAFVTLKDRHLEDSPFLQKKQGGKTAQQKKDAVLN